MYWRFELSATRVQPFEEPKGEGMSEGEQERKTMAPGDKAQPGAENAGQDLCPECDGTGRYRDEECKNCGGSGTIWVPVGTP